MTESAAAKPTVAFIGTGVMGVSMAGHLMDAGYPLVVFNRTKSRAPTGSLRAGRGGPQRPARQPRRPTSS